MYKNIYQKGAALLKGLLKILLLMRLPIFIILITVTQLFAEGTRGQVLTYKKKEVSISELFKEIKHQTGYNVLWSEGKLNSHELIDVSFYNTPLDVVLDRVLFGRAVSYGFVGKAIVIKAGGPPFRFKEDLHGTIDVRGRVLDENNKPLVGAVVKIKGTKTTVATDNNGEFNLKGVDDKAILIISFLGYETLEIKGAESSNSIKLVQSNDKLNEVEINAGYYTVTDRNRTGSISRITSPTIEKQPVNNVLQALQNRLPGLEITQLNGIPGGGFKVQIRGRNSLRLSGGDALYIVDGVLYPSTRINSAVSQSGNLGSNPLSFINPNDIESIEVLKDADATAIYGSRGANGVILISTKKGSQGPQKIDANISQGFSRVGNRMELMNTSQYLEMRREALKNDGLTIGPTDYDLNGAWDQDKYTDWQDVLIGGTAKTTNAALNISGGNQNGNYLLGGNYYSEGTVFPTDYGFKRGGGHTSLTFGSVESKFKATFSGNFSRTVSKFAQSPLIQIFQAPNAPDAYDEFGQLVWSNNGVRFTTNPVRNFYNTVDTKTDNLITNIQLSYQFFKGLTLKASLGYNLLKREELAKTPNIGVDPATNPPATRRQSDFANNFNESWIAEPQLNYDTQLGKSRLNAILGMSFQENNAELRNIRASNFSSDALMEDIRSATVFSVPESSFAAYKYASAYARLNYSLADRYYLNLTGRRDGSTKFGPGRQFGNFGAIGAAWIISEEEFMKDLSFISLAKLRGSYGITGNDQIGDYVYLQKYTSGASYQGSPTLTNGGIVNPYYSWETNKKAEIALQIGLLKDRLNIEIAYFRNRSSNQLISQQLPPSVGSFSIIANLPATVQNTGLEMTGNFRIISGKRFNWTADINVTIPKNKLLSYPDLVSSPNALTFIIGEPLDILKHYNVTMNQQTGMFVAEDKNNDGVINNADQYLNKFLGQTLYGGVNNAIDYKQFSLQFLFSFTRQLGSSLMTTLGAQPGAFVGGLLNANKPIAALDRWQKPGDIAQFPKFTTISATNYNLAASSGEQRFSDNSFIRLKNVSLSYNFPKQWLSRIKVKNLQLNVLAQNVFTLTKFKGLDPETQSLTLPPLQTFSVGLNVTF